MNVIRNAISSLPGRWLKGDLSDSAGNYCGIGHLYAANGLSTMAPDTDEVLQAKVLMSNVALEQYPDRVSESYDDWEFAVFNDHPDTTEDEVIAVMEKAAVRFEERL